MPKCCHPGETVVVIVVDAAHLFLELRRVVVIDRATLVVGAHEFRDHRVERLQRKAQFETDEAVEPTIFVEGGTFVFKKVVVIKPRGHFLAARACGECEAPGAHCVARSIGIAVAVGGVATSFGHEGVEGFAQSAGQVHRLRSTEIVVDGSAELRSHFSAGRQGHDRGVGADAHVARFFVIAHPRGIASACSVDGAPLPIAIEQQTVSQCSAEGDGHSASEGRPPGGDAPSQGGRRHGVAAEHERAGGKRGVVDGGGVRTEPEREVRSADDRFGKGGRGREAREQRGTHGGFDRETPARTEVGVGRCRGARKTNVQLWPVAVYCSAAVAVGPEPEGRVRAAAHGDECFAEIMKSGAVV